MVEESRPSSIAFPHEVGDVVGFLGDGFLKLATPSEECAEAHSSVCAGEEMSHSCECEYVALRVEDILILESRIPLS